MAFEIKNEDRILELNTYPCMKCHKNFGRDKIVNLTLPLKKEHMQFSFQHMSDNKKSCLLCHSESSPNELVLLDGKKISMNESPQLCGQCHGPIYIDWKQNIHGKLSGKGTQNATKHACVHCHNPHSPVFKQMKAEPPPHQPKLLIKKKDDHGPE